ncbi:limonene-1,2-epoxide hydrolase family protein [Nocardioides sp.]|uniref:limonene-1,2-epoxide hydrolase family protein n=1 Tax=Nocardioides sp. TaxID=35761 RepID=UPI002B26A962|nr:limonene-1,2-epoxide hydrolase family protein [Nocardioides sp.]
MAETTDAAHVVRSCLTALQEGDVEAAQALLDPEVEWRNSGLPTVRGRRAHQALRDMIERGIGFEAELHHLAADGDVVLTDRTDVLTYRRFRTQFWVCGTFEVRDGRIVLWDDHFSLTNFVGAGVLGLVRSVLPR